MWEYEHVEVAPVPPAAVWRLWSGVGTWPDWNPDVVAATIDGPFAAGSSIAMTLGSGDVVPLRLVHVAPGTRFDDEAALDGITVRTRHEVGATPDGGCRVTYATAVSGDVPPEVLAEVGGGITADFPATVAALLAHCAAGPEAAPGGGGAAS